MTTLGAIVLAAGRSRRMHSKRSKVLHQAAGRPLIHYPVRAALRAGAHHVVVVVSPGDRGELERYLTGEFGSVISIAEQDPPLGTGHAAQIGLGALSPEVQRVLILCGDTPLLTAGALGKLALDTRSDRLIVGTCELSDPSGYGRILRDGQRQPIAIREDRDLTDSERAIREVNSGIYCAPREPVEQALTGLSNKNAQGEYYLTDIVGYFVTRAAVQTVTLEADVMVGVNTRSQLEAAQQTLFARIAHQHRQAGVSVDSAARIDDAVELGQDIQIGAGVHLRGGTVVHDDVTIDVGAVITDSVLEKGCHILPYTVITQSVVGENASAGPFAHLRPGSLMGQNSKVGNFVEIKNSNLAEGVKAGHLSYLGDSDVGANTNIGAGTIVCNFDGRNKHRTTIGANVFIGSDSQLVAPVTVGEGAYVATSTTVTEDVPADALVIGRVRQVVKPERARSLRERWAKR